jgi:iron complex outermembrane receptor protein
MNEGRMLEAYMVNDLLLSYRLQTSFSKEVSLRLGVYNIFNQLYQSNGYTYSYFYGGNLITENFFYPQAGTHFLGGVTLKF